MCLADGNIITKLGGEWLEDKCGLSSPPKSLIWWSSQ